MSVRPEGQHAFDPDPIEPFFTFDVSGGGDAAYTDRPVAGDSIAGWSIARVIAHGRLASVYEVQRMADSSAAPSPQDSTAIPPVEAERAAMKVFDPHSMDEAAMRRFRLHATLLGQSIHPGLVRVLAWGVTPAGTPYLVMDLVAGYTHDEWIRERSPSAEQRISLIAMAAEAVGAAHIESGLVHRDIKPSNVMVESGADPNDMPRARVIDFGVAMMASGSGSPLQSLQTEGGAIVGTPAYMAPEQLHAGTRAIDPRADVYALAVMLVESLAGRRPVVTEGLSLVDIAREKERARPTASMIRRWASGNGMSIGRSTATTLASALSPETEDRQADGRAFAIGLRRGLRGMKPVHRPVSVLRRARRFLSREPRLAIALLVSAMLAVLSAAAITALAVRADRARRAEQAQTDRLVGLVKSWSNGAFVRAFQTPGSEAALVTVTESVINALEEASSIRPDDIELMDQLALAYTQLASVVGTPVGRSLGDEARSRALHDKAIEAATRSAALYAEQGKANAYLARLSIANAIKRRIGVTADEAERRDLLAQAIDLTSEIYSQHADDEIVVMTHAGTLELWALEHAGDDSATAALENALRLVESLPPGGPRAEARAHQAMILHLALAGELASTLPRRAEVELGLAETLLAERTAGLDLDPLAPFQAMFLRLRARCQMIAAQIAHADARWDDAESLADASTAETARLAAADPGSGPSVLDHATRLRERAQLLLARCDLESDMPHALEVQRLAQAANALQTAISFVRGYRPDRPRTRYEQAEIDRCQILALDVRRRLEEIGSLGE